MSLSHLFPSQDFVFNVLIIFFCASGKQGDHLFKLPSSFNVFMTANEANLPDVLGRLEARQVQRAARAAKRIEELQCSSDPRESINNFLEEFEKQRQELQASLESVLQSSNNAAEKQALESFATHIAQLEKVWYK